MTEELKLSLDDAVADVKKRFDAMEKNRQILQSKQSEITKQLQEIGVELIRLQGENKALMALSGKDPEGKPLEKGEKKNGNT